MGMYTYQNKAWEMMSKKLDELAKEDTTGKYAEMKQLMSDTASEAFKKPTKTEDVADLLMDAVNSSMFDEREFATQVTQRTHRTLQQSFMRAIMQCIGQWSEAYKEGRYDLRNQATCETSNKIKDAVKDEYFPLV